MDSARHVLKTAKAASDGKRGAVEVYALLGNVAQNDGCHRLGDLLATRRGLADFRLRARDLVDVEVELDEEALEDVEALDFDAVVLRVDRALLVLRLLGVGLRLLRVVDHPRDLILLRGEG